IPYLERHVERCRAAPAGIHHVLVEHRAALDEVVPVEALAELPVERLPGARLQAACAGDRAPPGERGLPEEAQLVLALELTVHERLPEILDPRVPLIGVRIRVEA